MRNLILNGTIVAMIALSPVSAYAQTAGPGQGASGPDSGGGGPAALVPPNDPAPPPHREGCERRIKTVVSGNDHYFVYVWECEDQK